MNRRIATKVWKRCQSTQENIGRFLHRKKTRMAARAKLGGEEAAFLIFECFTRKTPWVIPPKHKTQAGP